jgi:hypothetical protein
MAAHPKQKQQQYNPIYFLINVCCPLCYTAGNAAARHPLRRIFFVYLKHYRPLVGCSFFSIYAMSICNAIERTTRAEHRNIKEH